MIVKSVKGVREIKECKYAGGDYIKYYMNNSDGASFFEAETKLFELMLDDILNRITLHCTDMTKVQNSASFFEEIVNVLNHSKNINNKLMITKTENRKLILELKRKNNALADMAASCTLQRSNKRFLPL